VKRLYVTINFIIAFTAGLHFANLYPSVPGFRGNPYFISAAFFVCLLYLPSRIQMKFKDRNSFDDYD
jgi:hypothetical protein